MSQTQRNSTVAYILLTAALLAVPAWAADDTKAKPPEGAEVAKLIEQLGDEKFEVREAATEKLTKLGEAAHPALKEALKKEKLDPEVASRIEKIISATSKPASAASVTDPATGITVCLENGGASLCATKDQKKIWETRLGQARGETLSIANGQVTVQPCGWVVDLATGKVLMVGQQKFQMRIQGGAARIMIR